MSSEELDSMLRGVAAAPAVRPPPRVGERLGGRYVIESFLGEGGMGMVFRAFDEKLGESVALKLVRAADEALRDEVRLAQKVTHPNVCRTFDLEDLGGRQLIKMEYVPGETLATRLRRDRNLPIAEVVHIARAIADGLAASHRQQIVHGDLKPGNVMLDAERVVLMDFGIARHVAAPIDNIRGTIGYMAPEVVRDQTADARADYYALGCLVYEMLAGEHVFGTGPTIAVAARHVSDPIPDVRRTRPDTPRWLARACHDLLAKRPADRTAGLARLHAGPRSPARIIVPFVLAAGAIAALAAWRLSRTEPVWQPVIHDYPVFRENMDMMQFSPDGQWIVFAGDRDGPHWHAYIMSRETGQTTRLPTPPDKAVFGPTFTRDGKAVLYTLTDDTGETPRIMRQPVAGSPPHAVGDPRELFPGWYPTECGDGIAYSVRAPTGSRLMLSPSGGEPRQLYVASGFAAPSCDPTGGRIVLVENAANGGDVIVVDRMGNVQHVVAGHGASSAIFTPDGHSLVISKVVDGKMQLFELPVAGGEPHRLVTDDGPDLVNAISSDGRYLAFTRDTTTHTPVLRTPGGERTLTRQSIELTVPQFATADLLVVAASEAGGSRICTLSIADGTVTPIASGRSPFPSPDGRTVYFESAPGVLSAVAIDGGTPRRIATLPGRLQGPGNAGPDGEYVLVKIDDDVAGYQVRPDGAVVADGVRGLVAVAPTSGWRAVTLLSDAVEAPIELALVPPGVGLDHAARRFRVTSLRNRWLDAHRIAYCVVDRCEILDVDTNAVTGIDVHASLDSMLSPDGKSAVDAEMSGTVTRHVITNFDQR